VRAAQRSGDRSPADRLSPGAWTLLAIGAGALVALPWLAALAFSPPGVIGLIAADFNIYMDATTRLLAGDGWYLDRQLHGPYAIEYGDILYPPVLAWWLAPFVVVPAPLWWVIPLALLGWALWSMRPARWTWALMLLCLVWPLTFQQFIKGNPVMWVLMFEAVALWRGWPSTFVLLKPSLAPFALFGIRRRSWWLNLAVLGLLSLPVLGATLLYPQVIIDSRGGGLLYSIRDVPLMLIPLIAWIGRRRPAEEAAASADVARPSEIEARADQRIQPVA